MNFLEKIKGSRCLQFTSASGGGHAAMAQAINDLSPDYRIQLFTKDIFISTIGGLLGNQIHNHWNYLMKSENVAILRLTLLTQKLGEYFLSYFVVAKTIFWVMKYQIDHVVSPQPVNLAAIATAVRIVNMIHVLLKTGRKEIRLYILMTELPTEHVDNYFSGLKRLSSRNLKVCTLVSQIPLIKTYEDKKLFWKLHTNFTIDQIIEESSLPLRRPFLIKKRSSTSEVTLKIQEKQKESLKLTICPKDRVLTLMLGSQGSQRSTLSYVKELIVQAKLQTKQTPFNCLAFIFCGSAKNKRSLRYRVSKLLQQEKGAIPSWLKLIPLDPQLPDLIAPLFQRSDLTITRSGGLTTMELIATSPKKILIHSNSLDPIKSMPTWEAGNFNYLKQKKKAEVITPATCKESFNQFFSMSN